MRASHDILPDKAQSAPVSSGMAPSKNLQGALLMVISTLTLACNDAIMKYVAQDLPLYEAITIRGLFVLPLLIGYSLARGSLRLHVPRRDLGKLGWRSIGEIGATVLYLVALQQMAMANISAIMQSLPLLVTLAAAIMFKEKLGIRRLGAIAVGFIGVLIILRPGTSAFDIWSILALASVLSIVLRDMATRTFSAEMTSTTVAIYAALVVVVFSTLMYDGSWRVPTIKEALLLFLAGSLIGVAYITAVATMRVGEVSFVAPFRYSSLIWAILLGVVVFGEWPDIWTQLGGGLIVAAGLYTILQEGRVRKSR